MSVVFDLLLLHLSTHANLFYNLTHCHYSYNNFLLIALDCQLQQQEQ